MLNKTQKIAIGKNFIISLLFICLIFVAFDLNLEDTYAVDLNETGNGLSVEFNIEDKLENSQTDEILEVDNGDANILKANYVVEGRTFQDIQNKINGAREGDKIILIGDYNSNGGESTISVNKRLTITSTSTATLNGNGVSGILYIENNGAGTVISNLKFINANSEVGSALFIDAKDVVVDSCCFENNHAEHGGVLSSKYKLYTAENATVKNCNFTNNSGYRDDFGDFSNAGAVGLYGNNSKLINCIFDSNWVKSNAIVYGGAVQIGLDEPNYKALVYKCTFINNKAIGPEGKSHGGAGCVRNGVEYIDCIFINNSAGQGGALTFHASGKLQRCTFINNTAVDLYGGAVSTGYSYDTMELEITNCYFEGNDAPKGGAIQALGSDIDIIDSNFTQNHADTYGGALNIEAINVKILNSNFDSNIAEVDGGAIYTKGNNTIVDKSSFTHNEARPDYNQLDDGLGGAIYINSTRASVANSKFYYNTARNGSAVYYDVYGDELVLTNDTLFENQAWVYSLPIYANDIYYGEAEQLKSIIHGGNNIAKYNNLAVSNAIYNAADYSKLSIDGESPVRGARNNGRLYQDDREYNMEILLTVQKEDGTLIYNQTLNSNYLGAVSKKLTNLQPGKYYVTAKHFEDTYYKQITNTTTFNVIPKIDSQVRKEASSDSYNYGEVVVWTLDITNNGPNKATNVTVTDVLPKGLIYSDDDSGRKYNSGTGVLKIGDLDVGEHVIVNIYARVNKTGEIVNNANVTSKEFDVDLSNNYDQARITVPETIDLEVKKYANNSNPNYGDLIKWTIVVRNNGPDVAHNVKVTDIIPDSLIDISSDGNYNVRTGIWDVGALGLNKEVRLNIFCRVNATGTIQNDVSVKGREVDRNMSNNHDSGIIHVNASCDLAIDKSIDVAVANYTDEITWKLVITNNGPDDATGVKVIDALPDGLVYVRSVLDRGTYSNGVIDVGSLAVGERLTLNIVCKVNKTGTLVNVASIKGNEYDYDMSNNRDDASIFINRASDLEVIKTVNVSNPSYHDCVTWTVTVRNNGPNVAHDVVVSDLLPKSLVWKSDTGDGSYNRGTGKWTIGRLDVGESVQLSIVTYVNATGTIRNDASVRGQEVDYNPSNNKDSEVIKVNASCDLAIDKSIDVAVANYTDEITWKLVITNNGPDDATGVKVTDALPDGLIYVNSILDRGTYSNGVIDVGSLAVGERLTFKIVCRVNKTGTLVNVASVKGNEYDYDLSNNRDDASIFINRASDLEVIKTVNVSNPSYHDCVTWTVTVRNNGPNVAHDVVVSDLLPKSLVWKSDTGNGNYNHVAGKWTIGRLDIKESVQLNIVTYVNATGTIRNDASVSGREVDYNPSNNRDYDVIKVNASCDLAVDKSIDVDKANYTDEITWKLVVTNNGPSVATGVKVIDALPDGLVYVRSVLDRGTYSNGVIDVGSLAVGERLTFKIVCRVNKTGTLVNVASVKGNEYDYDLSNNRDDASIYINPASDLEVIKAVNVSNPNYHDCVTWTIIVRNNGPDVAHDVVVSDLLPKSLVWKSDTGNGNYNHVSGKWTIGQLDSKGFVQLKIVTQVNATGITQNNASVKGFEFDYDLSNNKDNASIDVAKTADVSVVKIVNNSNPSYHDIIKWTIIAKNNGPDKATSVVVDEVLPNGLIIKQINASKGIYDNGIWSVCCLEKGEVQYLEIICMVNKTGKITNIASITAEEVDLNISNNRDDESIDVPLTVDLEVIKQVSNKSPYFGEAITWLISVKNNGPDVATNVVLYDLLDDGLLYSDYSSTLGTFDGNKWDIGSLNNRQVEYLNIACIANKLGDIANNAFANASEVDRNNSNNMDGEMITVYPLTDLSVVKIVNNSNPNYLDLIKWYIIVSNNGPNSATGVVVRDILPDGLEFIESSEYIDDDGNWYIGDLDVYDARELDIICRVVSTGVFRNFVAVSGDETDPNPDNNEDDETVNVAPACDLSITKTVSKYYYKVGDAIDYSIRIANNGPDEAQNVKVNEILDSSLTLKLFRATKGSYNEENQIWEIDALDDGESAELYVRAMASGEGIVKNMVFATSDTFDYNLDNNNASVEVNVSKKPDENTNSNGNIDYSSYLPEMPGTGNPFVVLIISVVFSVIFLGCNFSKKR